MSCKIGIKNIVEKTLENKPWFSFNGEDFIKIIESPLKKINKGNIFSVAQTLANYFNKAINADVKIGKVFYVKNNNLNEIGVSIEPTAKQLDILNSEEEKKFLKDIELEELEEKEREYKQEVQYNQNINEAKDFLGEDEPYTKQNLETLSINATDRIQFSKSKNEPKLVSELIFREIFDKIKVRFLKYGEQALNYEIVTPEEAVAILKEEGMFSPELDIDPKLVEPFYIKGRGVIYIPNHIISLEAGFHEFAHPFVDAVLENNVGLFNRLKNATLKVEEGKKTINEVKILYPKYLDERGDLTDIGWKEVITRSIGKLAFDYYDASKESDKTFIEFLKELLKKISNYLKKLFEDSTKLIEVSEITPTTSLHDLAIMLNLENSIELEKTISKETKSTLNNLLIKIKFHLEQKIRLNERRKVKDKRAKEEELKKLRTKLELIDEVESIEIFIDDAYNKLVKTQEIFENLLSQTESKSYEEIIAALMHINDIASGYSILDEISQADLQEIIDRPVPGLSHRNIPPTIGERLEYAIKARENIKKDYVHFGIPLLAKWLLNFSSKTVLTSVDKRVQEHYKTIEEIESDPKLTDERKKQKINTYLKKIENLEDYTPDEKKIVDQLRNANKDEGIIDFLFSPLISSEDSVIALFAKAIKDKLEDKRLLDIELAKKADKAYNTFLEKTGRKKNNVSKTNKDIYEETAERAGVDENGDTIWEPTMSFVQKYKITDFIKDRDKFFKELGPKPVTSYYGDTRKAFEIQESNYASAAIKKTKTISVRINHSYKEGDVVSVIVNKKHTATNLKIKTIVNIPDFTKISDKRKDEFARAIGDYVDFKDFISNNNYLREDSFLSRKYPEMYRFINGKTSGDIIAYEVTNEKADLINKEELDAIKEWQAKISSWFKANTQPKPEEERAEIIAEKQAEQQNGIITQEEYDEWLSSVIQEYYDKKTKQTEVSYRKELSMPSDKWLNDKWLDMYDEKSGLPINPVGDYHKFLTDVYFEKQELLPKNFRTGYRLPSIQKDFNDRVLEQGVKKAVKVSIDETLHTKNYDTGLEMTDLEGVGAKFIPVLYTQSIDNSDISLDLLSSVLLFSSMAEKYDGLNSINAEISLFKETINQRKTTKIDSVGEKVMDLFASKFNIKKPVLLEGESFSKKHVDAFIDMIVYNEMQKKEEFLGKNMGKITNKLLNWASITTISADFLKGVSNNLQGNIQALIESSGGDLLNLKSFRKGKAFFMKNTGEFIKDFTKISPDSLATQLVELYDAIQGDFKDNYGRNITGSVAKKLFRTDTLFFNMQFAEMELQYSFLFGILENKKVLDINDNAVISLLEAYKKYGIEDVEKNTDFTEKDRRDLQNAAHSLNKSLNGVYNDFDKGTAQRFSLGRLGIMYRKHVVPGYRRRFKKEYVDQERGVPIEGYYRTFYQKVLVDLKDYKLGIFKRWSTYNDADKKNIRRVLADASFIFGLWMFVLILKSVGDDNEDVKNSYVYNFLLYQMTRMRSETASFISPNDAYRIVKSPSAMTTTLERIIKFADQFLFTWDPDKLSYKKKTGVWDKGDNKSWAYFLKMMGFSGNNVHPEKALEGFNVSLVR